MIWVPRSLAWLVGSTAILFRRSAAARIGAGLLAVHVVLALTGPLLAPYPYAELHILHSLEPPSLQYLAGTDQYGRDELSRIMWGARGTLQLAAVSTLVGVTGGVFIGMVCGLYRGVVDEVLMRMMDAAMSVPALLLAMLILTTLGDSEIYVLIGIAVVFIPRVARVVRGVALSLAAAEFVEAARTRAESGLYIIFREMLPNAWGPIVVEATIRFAYAILLATSLGFLGLGTHPPFPDWGQMINDALPLMAQAPWLTVAPAIAISTAIVGANLAGEGIRETLHIRRMAGEL